jgi:hypothetical protein
LKIHVEVLKPTQSRVLARLGPLMSARSFYLGGGTALALQLGHRRSADFDWFTGQELKDPLRLATEIRDALPLRVDSTERGTLHATLSRVPVSFIEYRYRLLRPLSESSAPAFRMASLEDIACMKLAAVAQRGSRKDFVDVHALGRRIPLARMLALYSKKYGIRDHAHVLAGLSYFDDAERESMPALLRRGSWEEMKREVRRWVVELAR